MTQEIKLAEELIDFIHQSPTAFHVVENTAKELEAKGYKYLDITSVWNIDKGGKYYTTKSGSALFAFQIRPLHGPS
jgi:aspartyl aminopeptidase